MNGKKELVTIKARVTGTGTLRVLKGETLIDEFTSEDGDVSLEYREKEHHLNFEYVRKDGDSDLVGALLMSVARTSGTMLFIR